MLRPLWRFIRDGENRQILSWLGGGVVIIVPGIWAALNYFFIDCVKWATDERVSECVNIQPGLGGAQWKTSRMMHPVRLRRRPVI